LYLIGLGGVILGTILLVKSLIVGISLFLLIVGGVLLIIVDIDALIKTARLAQWTWFVFLLVFSGITLPIYLFVVPHTASISTKQLTEK